MWPEPSAIRVEYTGKNDTLEGMLTDAEWSVRLMGRWAATDIPQKIAQWFNEETARHQRRPERVNEIISILANCLGQSFGNILHAVFIRRTPPEMLLSATATEAAWFTAGARMVLQTARQVDLGMNIEGMRPL